MSKINDLSESGRRLAEGSQNGGILARGDVRGAIGDGPGGPWGTRGSRGGCPKGPKMEKVNFDLWFARVNFENCHFA